MRAMATRRARSAYDGIVTNDLQRLTWAWGTSFQYNGTERKLGYGPKWLAGVGFVVFLWKNA